MSTATEVNDMLRELLDQEPGDDLTRKAEALCQGLYDETSPAASLDRAWAEKMRNTFGAWLRGLATLEESFRSRVAVFRNVRLDASETAGLPEMHDEFTSERLERTWGAITEYFESVMPDHVVDSGDASLSIDTLSGLAFWCGTGDEQGVSVDQAVHECLIEAGEFSPESAKRIADRLISSLLEGYAPLPGFRFMGLEDAVASWRWISPDCETDAELAGAGHSEEDSVIAEAIADAVEQQERAGHTLAAVAILSCAKLSADAAEKYLEKFATSESGRRVGRVILRGLAQSFLTQSQGFLQSGNVKQFQRACQAMANIAQQLNSQQSGRENATTL